MAVPQVPARPARTQHQQQQVQGETQKIPPVPPRPGRKAPERSVSPNRENLTRSPLNDPLPAWGQVVYGNKSQNASTSSLGVPQRPPSVNLPSIGQEGQEYGDIDEQDVVITPTEGSQPGSPTHTRNVGHDLPLHAPRPSLHSSDAKTRVQVVTRTDSHQAAAAGIGKISSPPSESPGFPTDLRRRSLRSSISLERSGSAASTERPGSAQHDQELGIPEIGLRAPLLPNAGDVQAPSPAPLPVQPMSGIGFHANDPNRPRNHGRRQSGHQVFHGPPGSYGLHGHGCATPHDKFERAWYEKHPDVHAKHEQGQYGPALSGNRPEWAMSSNDLNKLVRDSETAGFGTAASQVPIPDEQIGYMASEEYASRINSTRPPSSPPFPKPPGSASSQVHTESPLRNANVPEDALETDDLELTKITTKEAARRASQGGPDAIDEKIRIASPEEKWNKIHGKFQGNAFDQPSHDLGPKGGNTSERGGIIEERGYSTPILASDEVNKHKGHAHDQPAIPPTYERHDDSFHRSQPHSASNSRPSSRPGSIHGFSGLSRYISHDEYHGSHTPLEDVEEYEPLFSDEDEKKMAGIKVQTLAERLKARPQKQRFPSQDIWEDTPNSLRLETEVKTPEPKQQSFPASAHATVGQFSKFETPEQEKARKGEVSETEREKLIPAEERLKKSHFKPHIVQEMHRPSVKQRFPSRDIWEDSPDSAYLQTTVGESPPDNDIKSPTDDGLRAGAVVHTTGRPVDGELVGKQQREAATAGAPLDSTTPEIPARPVKKEVGDAHPPVPARPVKKAPSEVTSPSELSTAEGQNTPVIPGRSKPQVPARPARSSNKDEPETPLTKTTSIGSNDSASSKSVTSPPPISTKPKPALPARPMGSKISALQAGFMGDLEKRLKIGPQAPPPKVQEKALREEEHEKGPLSDARKGRARGPTRRKPTASPSASASAEEKPLKAPTLSFIEPLAIWEISNTGDATLRVHSKAPVQGVEVVKDIETATTDIPAVRTSDDVQEAKADPEMTVSLSSVAEPVAPTTKNTSLAQQAETVEDKASIPASFRNALSEVPSPASEKANPMESSGLLEEVKHAEKGEVESTDKAVQTGQTDIVTTPSGSAGETKTTIYQGGRAHEEGNVVVNEAEDPSKA